MMWDKEILEQCGCWFTDTGECVKDDLDLNKFARVIIEKEREACAEVCKKHADFYAGLEPSPIAQSAWAACIDNRDTILARGNA